MPEAPFRLGITLMTVDPPTTFVHLARLAEESGFDYLWVTDSSLHGRYAYAYLTLAAAETRRIKLGTNCTHPLAMHPAMSANAIATVNEISGGRAILGVGAGGGPTRELGFERSAGIAEVKRLVVNSKRLFAGDQIDDDSGVHEYHRARMMYGLDGFKPPAVYVTASGPRMIELAAFEADGVLLHCSASPAGLAYALNKLGHALRTNSRDQGDIDAAWHLWGAFDEDLASAREQARPVGANMARSAARYCDIAGIDPDVVSRISHAYDARHFTEAKAAQALVPDSMVDELAVAGGADVWRARFEAGLAAGVTHFEIFALGDKPQLIRELGHLKESW